VRHNQETGAKPVKFTRRDTLILAASATIATSFGLGAAQGQEGTTKDVAALANVAIPDKVLGSADAKVTVIEYASPTCPHCAQFSNDVYPVFKTEYVDSGKVKFILRPYIRNLQDAVVFLLAYSAGDDKFHQVVETYFKTQGTWGLAEKPRSALLDVAKQLGFTEESFDAALANQELFDGMKKMQEQASNEFKLEGTPTFYINGKQLTGEKTLEELKAEIDPLLA
jgi:protein-disulfide isomerase